MSNINAGCERSRVAHELPDGSVCVVEPFGVCSSLISREVDGVVTWAQSFIRRDDHAGQVSAVVEKMRAWPASFVRWTGSDAE